MKKLIVFGILCASLVRPAAADIIFDNSLNDSNIRFNPGRLEIGDEVWLAGQQRYLTNFAFEYWGTNSAGAGNPLFSGSVQALVDVLGNLAWVLVGIIVAAVLVWWIKRSFQRSEATSVTRAA